MVKISPWDVAEQKVAEHVKNGEIEPGSNEWYDAYYNYGFDPNYTYTKPAVKNTMSEEYQPFEQLMKSKRAGHTRPEGDFAEFLKAKGKMGVPSLDPLANRSMVSGTASPGTPSLEPVALDATPQGKPTGSARSAAGAKPCHGPDAGSVHKAEECEGAEEEPAPETPAQ